jgi:N-acetylmuramoyl-L-alanine amidase
MSVQIIQDLIPKGRRNRPGYKLTPEYITIHDTANPGKGADAAAHAAYVKGSAAASIPSSWHFTVDDKVIYQHLPLTENGWHCGDGTNGPGNRQSIGIEICENKDGNRAQAEANAAWLTAKLLRDYGLKIAAVKQHYNWSGKNCPNVLRGRKNGWSGFLAAVEANLNPAAAKAPATPAPSGGALYRVQIGAFAVRANAEACLKKAQAAGFKDAFIVGGAPAAVAPAPKPAPAPATTPAPKPTPAIRVGSKVKVKAGAKDYNGVQLASFVYGRTYNVIQVSGDRVVIGQGKTVTAAVRLKDLTLV